MSTRIVACWITMGVAAAWVWSGTAGARAQLHIRVEAGRHVEGSVHFGSRPAARVHLVVPPATVRSEHYRDRDHDPVHSRNPYGEAYFKRLRPGYRPVVVGPTQYYYYPSLPPGSRTVVVRGTSYYLSDGVYYQPHIYQGQTVYMVVPSPVP